MRQGKTLNVSLTPELRAYVASRVASGRFGSASEVVRAALRILEQQDAKELSRSNATVTLVTKL